jgi:DNA gyrase subunit A
VPVDAAADAAPDGTEPPGGAGAQGESSSAESTPGESTPGETAGAAVAASPDAAPFEGVAAGGDDATIDMPAAELPAAGASGKCMVLTACVNGFGKRTPVDEYRLIRRGGKGVTNIKTSDRNGDVVALKAVCDDDELMLITEKGILIRTRVSEIRETGRNAQGVKLIRIDEGDRLVAMAKINTGVDTSKKPAGDGESPAAQEISAPPAAADAIGETDGGAAEGDARRDDAAEDGNELPSEQ